MVIRRMWQISLIWLFVFSVVGCASSTDHIKNGNSMPEGWSVIVPPDLKVCVSINGDYQILGLGKLEQESPLTETRLDVALGHTFPSSRMPKRVRISVEEGTNILNFQFGEPVNQGFSESMSCSNGWYTFEQSRTDQYVGDGANLDYANRILELGKANDGNLIVHLILEAQFSSFSVLKSHEVREIWSKYETFGGSKVQSELTPKGGGHK
jgi:hypothetical protein